MNITDHPQNFRFTKDNARENAAKSWQARRERKAKLEAEAAKGRQSTPQSERLALEIERIVQMIEKCKDPDGLQKLSATHTRLFKAWQVLTGTPNPGSRRSKQGRPQAPEVYRIPAPTPQEAQPAN
jgi:protein subunit release factor B